MASSFHDGSPDRDFLLGHTRIVVRPIATPLSLGFLALAVTSFVVAGYELAWIDRVANADTVGLAVLAFAVPLQAASSGFGFLTRDLVAATGMGVLAGLWLGLGLTYFTGTPGATSPALGLLLIGAATALLVPVTAAANDKRLAALVMGTAALRFYLAGAYEMSASTGWRLAAGACGLLLAALAVYAALAFELESTHHKTVLPTGRRGRGLQALTASFGSQFDDIEHESGVRQEL